MTNEQLNQKFSQFMEGMVELRQSIVELRESQAQTSFEIKTMQAEIRENQAQTSLEIKAMQAEVTAKQAEVSTQQKQTDTTLSNLGINVGYSSEEYFYRTLEQHMVLGGIRYDNINRHVHDSLNRMDGEIDILLVNGNSLAIIEVKHKAHHSDIGQLRDSKIRLMHYLMPESVDYKIYFGIATMSSYAKLITEAKKEQVYLLTQQGDNEIKYLNRKVTAF